MTRENLKTAFTGLMPEGSWKALVVLFIGLLLTTVFLSLTRGLIRRNVIQDFEFSGAEIQSRMEVRLRAHAQLLRSGVALFAASDTVTREAWTQFYENLRIEKHMPGVQGFGYSMIIAPQQLSRHIQETRESGFPGYTIWPEGERDTYTSIIYLEPFIERNLRAFGYDMFSEEVRNKAMKTARDSAFAVLSGKVFLVQETVEDVQAGILMYSPVYRRNMPAGTVEERRAAIKGWVYSPYRVNDLTQGILGTWNPPGPNRIRLRIYDNISYSDDNLLFDSQPDGTEGNSNEQNLIITLPVRLNSEELIMVLSRNSDELSLLNSTVLVVLVSGISISLLLFFLTISLNKTMSDVKKIKQLNLQLEKLNRDKDRFISILGHDLRNPFNSLLGFLDILRKDFHQLEKQKTQNFLNYSYTVAKNTYNLLENLMEWSKTQSENVPFKPELCNFKEICNEIRAQINPYANAKNIKVNSCIEDIEIFADKNMLNIILRNLCTNAIKFTNRGGEVVLSAEQYPRHVKISVSDTGIGIHPDLLPELFDITRSATTKGTENETGTGLGLIICRELVAVHEGQIWAESQTGKGTSFIFTLPNQHERRTDASSERLNE